MIKKNKLKIVITSIITLLPILAGVLLWNKLPDKIPVHWNIEGTADSFGSRFFAVIGIPMFVFACHVICVLCTALDPKNKNIGGKALGVVLWICPVTSLTVSSIIISSGLGLDLGVERIVPFMIGILFIVLGNYCPKFKQNYTLGIRLAWTLNDEENWNHTHRFAGPVWIAGGLLTMFTAVINFYTFWSLLVIITLMVLMPVIYSYFYYKRHLSV